MSDAEKEIRIENTYEILLDNNLRNLAREKTTGIALDSMGFVEKTAGATTEAGARGFGASEELATSIGSYTESGVSAVLLVGSMGAKAGLKSVQSLLVKCRNKVIKSNGLVRPINGRLPINSKYAGKVFEFTGKMKSKYPHGIPFTPTGFPDFSRYATKKVKIKMDGTAKDFTAANKAAGLRRKPDGYTWHHHQDGVTMLLVPTDLHKAARHTGAVAILK